MIREMKAQPGENQADLNMSDFADGIYLVHLQSSNGTERIMRMMKQ